MDFEKKYPITQRPNEYLVVQWTRGYKQVDVYFNDELIGSVQGASKLLKGISLPSDLGTLTLKLSEKPVTLDVILDGYHSRVNVSHPVKELKRISTYFWIIAAFAIVAGAIEVGIFSGWPEVQTGLFGMNLVIFGLYIASAIWVGRGKPWAFYLGFAVFSFCTLISLIALMGGLVWGFILFIFIAIRIGGMVILIINMKTANAAVRHLKYQDPVMEELLDSKI